MTIALKIGRAHDCQLECERALRQIKEISQRLLPRKPEFLTEILHFKGLALMKLKSYDNAATAFQEEFKVAADKYAYILFFTEHFQAFFKAFKNNC